MSNPVIKNFDQYTVPISRFNKGEANKIFAEVKETGSKVVLKNNRREAVILSPGYYDFIMDLLEDEMLYKTAVQRIAEAEPTVSNTDVMKQFGITKEMIDSAEGE